MTKSSLGIRILIVTCSVIIPLVVAFIIVQPKAQEDIPGWVSALPHMNAAINSLTTVILVFGFFMIRRGKVELHKTAMLSAFGLGVVFLISYIIYHSNAPSQVFGDINNDGVLEAVEKETIGTLRYFYLGLLVSHIVLAILVVPLVLLALYFALSKRFEAHKKIVLFALPVWLYVSISGVLVYLLISPYY